MPSSPDERFEIYRDGWGSGLTYGVLVSIPLMHLFVWIYSRTGLLL